MFKSFPPKQEQLSFLSVIRQELPFLSRNFLFNESHEDYPWWCYLGGHSSGVLSGVKSREVGPSTYREIGEII